MGGKRTALCVATALLAVALTGGSALGASASPRIVGGQATTIAEYPWQVALVISPAEAGGNARQRQFCGGALVTPRIVLTAAHCVFDTDPDLPDPPPGDGTPRIDPDDVDVVLGRTTLSSTAGEEKPVVAVDYQSADDPYPSPPAPAYDPATQRNDVAYLVLASKPSPSTTAATIDIAAASETAVWAPGVFNEISGWGATSEGGSGSDSLRAASVPIVSDAECASDYGSEFDSNSMVCAGYEEGGIDTCQGDSGGPLEAPLEGGGYRLTGLTSWGAGCARPGAPGVYSRVAGPTLRQAIVSRVDGFESSIPIPAAEQEEVVSPGGGVPASGPPKYPPPSTQTQPNPPAQAPTVVVPTVSPRPSDPLAKCRKIRSKAKRKKCIRRVRATL